MEFGLLLARAHRAGESRLARGPHEAALPRRQGMDSAPGRSGASSKSNVVTPMNANAPWPELPYADWADTCATLHLWTQVAGKVRLACAPWANHWWHVPLYVSSRGLTTTAMPYGGR